jgi:small subunit ribosomal protein S5
MMEDNEVKEVEGLGTTGAADTASGAAAAETSEVVVASSDTSTDAAVTSSAVGTSGAEAGTEAAGEAGFSGGGRSGGRRYGEGRGGRGRGRDRDRDRDPADKEFVEKLVKLNRTAKVVKGGRRFSFSALTVIGDRKGTVGYGFGKANDVSEAIRKSIDKAKRNMVKLPVKNGTIPHEVTGLFKASRVLLKPACSGTGIIAGGPVRAIMEAGGVTDILSKSIGASSQYNVVKATFDCISKMMDAKAVAKNRGKSLNELWG